jgi:hypothetical protein
MLSIWNQKDKPFKELYLLDRRNKTIIYHLRLIPHLLHQKLKKNRNLRKQYNNPK